MDINADDVTGHGLEASAGSGFMSARISRNCSNAASRSSTISAAITSGAGRLSESESDSSFNQKISRLALSRLMRPA